MPDALDKAAEAVRNWIDAYVCSFCERPWRCKVCRTGKTMNKAEDIARTVLEAAGYDEAIALVEELRQWVHSECASITLYGPDDCKHCAYRSTCKLPKLAERIKAALARAGKEV